MERAASAPTIPQKQYDTPSSTGQRALLGALGFSIGTIPLPLPEPANTPGPITTDDLLPMMTLGCGEASLDFEPSAHTMASPAKMPRRPSSQLTSTPCLVQACAIAGPAAPNASADTRMENWSARVIIMPSSTDGVATYRRRSWPDSGSRPDKNANPPTLGGQNSQ